jgi:membrane protein
MRVDTAPGPTTADSRSRPSDLDTETVTGNEQGGSTPNTELPDRRRPWLALWQAVRDFQRDGRGQDAAALTYYAMLAFLPGLLAVVALIGLFGRHPETTDAVLDGIGRIGPDSAVDTFRGTVEEIITNKGGAGALLGIGVLGAIASATAWLDAFFRVANEICDSHPTRSFIRRKTLQVATAVAVGLGLAVLGVLVVVTGPIATEAGDAIGAGDAVVTVWSIAKWPVALALAVSLVGGLFRIATGSATLRWRSIVAGAVVAVATWTVTSVGFSLYVTSFGSYNATYGALGGIIVFLVWMWLTNAALIVGLTTTTRLDGAPR